MIVKVHMLAYQPGIVRKVVVPEKAWRRAYGVDVADGSALARCEAVFEYGQNDIQNVEGVCSVSMGDVIELHHQFFRVESFGFTEVEQSMVEAGD